jgi:hypothetical protein
MGIFDKKHAPSFPESGVIYPDLPLPPLPSPPFSGDADSKSAEVADKSFEFEVKLVADMLACLVGLGEADCN